MATSLVNTRVSRLALTAVSRATVAPSTPDTALSEEDDAEFEEEEDTFILYRVDPVVSLPTRVDQIDESGFIVKGSVLRYRSLGDAQNTLVLQRNPPDTKMYIVKMDFQAMADLSTFVAQSGLNAGEVVISDYATLFDNEDVDLTRIGEEDSLLYSDAEKAGIRNKFVRLNTVNSVYRKLLENDFNISNSALVEPPIVQTVNPESITIGSFSFLSNISRDTLPPQTNSAAGTVGASSGAASTSTTSTSTTSTSTSGGGY